MLKYTIALSEYGLPVLQISFHNLETLEIDLTDFYKDQTYLDTLYTQINEYVVTLPLS